MAIRAVVFDVGETLIDETRLWTAWADRLGLPRLTFLAALGAVIARGGDHRTVFGLFRPGFDVDAVQARRRAAGAPGRRQRRNPAGRARRLCGGRHRGRSPPRARRGTSDAASRGDRPRRSRAA